MSHFLSTNRYPLGRKTLYLYPTGRKSFVIISGGVNIYPQEIENRLLQHEAVLDAAVLGVPNEDFGEEVKAVVQVIDGREPDADLSNELIAFCRKRLSPIKCPRTVDFSQEFPRSPTGKLLKRKIHDQYRQGSTKGALG